ncbi:EAL domain-containing protein, partial [Roseburia intestinalis]|uniref:EAL domain-containing protein n=1 Tax=Roseburia intestinalis TaxID=166486 RepID=UPI0032BFCB1C
EYMALILRNGGSQSPGRWLRDPRNNQLAQSFGMEITAEGVETVEQLMFLCNLDCDDIQGYYFSRPLPVKEYEECLKEACM